MTFTTQDESRFQLPLLDKLQIMEASPRDLLSKLCKSNDVLPWQRFRRENLIEILDHIASLHGLMDSGIAAVANAFGVRSDTTSSKPNPQYQEWCFIEKILSKPLPAVPSPGLISLRKHDRVMFAYDKDNYRLPRLDQGLFNANGLVIGHFLKILHVDNAGKLIDNPKFVRTALAHLATRGFPSTGPHLSDRFQQQYFRSIKAYPTMVPSKRNLRPPKLKAVRESQEQAKSTLKPVMAMQTTTSTTAATNYVRQSLLERGMIAKGVKRKRHDRSQSPFPQPEASATYPKLSYPNILLHNSSTSLDNPFAQSIYHSPPDNGLQNAEAEPEPEEDLLSLLESQLDQLIAEYRPQ